MDAQACAGGEVEVWSWLCLRDLVDSHHDVEGVAQAGGFVRLCEDLPGGSSRPRRSGPSRATPPRARAPRAGGGRPSSSRRRGGPRTHRSDRRHGRAGRAAGSAGDRFLRRRCRRPPGSRPRRTFSRGARTARFARPSRWALSSSTPSESKTTAAGRSSPPTARAMGAAASSGVLAVTPTAAPEAPASTVRRGGRRSPPREPPDQGSPAADALYDPTDGEESRTCQRSEREPFRVLRPLCTPSKRDRHRERENVALFSGPRCRTTRRTS